MKTILFSSLLSLGLQFLGLLNDAEREFKNINLYLVKNNKICPASQTPLLCCQRSFYVVTIRLSVVRSSSGEYETLYSYTLHRLLVRCQEMVHCNVVKKMDNVHCRVVSGYRYMRIQIHQELGGVSFDMYARYTWSSCSGWVVTPGDLGVGFSSCLLKALFILKNPSAVTDMLATV